MAEAYLGEIRVFSFNFPPRGWALCNGQLMVRADNVALFSIIGTTYGGDGVTTFGLPNLRGRVPIHRGAGPQLSSYSLGQVGGEATHTLNANETPQHNHQMSASTQAPNQATVAGGVWAGNPGAYVAAVPDTTMQAFSLMSTGGQPHPNMGPFLTLNFCICLQGIFPSQQ